MRVSTFFLFVAIVLLLGCSTSAPLPSTTRRSSGDEAPHTLVPAYVLATTEETLVVPLDADEPTRRAPGLWLLDEGNGDVVRPPPDPETLGRPWCTSSGAIGECTFPRRIRLPSGLDPELDPACTCFRSPDTEVCDDDPFASLAYDEWATRSGVTWAQILAHRSANDPPDEGESDDCEDGSARPVSLHGGVLYEVGYEHRGCGGLPHARSYAASEPIASDGRIVSAPARAAWTCTNDGAFLDDWARPDPAEGCTFDGEAWLGETRGGTCSACERGVDSTIPFLRNGHIVVAGARVFSSGGGPRFTVTIATDDTCTSADPCGALSALPPIRERASDTALGFVASDELSGVLVESGRVSLYTSRDVRAVRRENLSGELLGVRYHADASRLIAALDRERSAGLPRRDCPSGETRRGDECVTACATDVDCRTTDPCDSVCLDGICAAIAVECAAGHPCAAGSRCERHVCVEIPLAAVDAGFEDAHGGTDWGQRCIAHLRAGDLDEAESACAAGLDAYEGDTTHGALLYDLGLIAEMRGDDVLARLYFEASLITAPSATVERALRDAGGPLRH